MAAGSVAAAVAFVDRPGVAVDVVETRTAHVLWRRVVAPGEHIELRYTHSVERTPVIEEFRAERSGLRLVAMRFVSQGAGLPTEGYTREGGQFVLRTDRRVGVLPLRVSSIAGHRLRLGAEEADLVALAGDGAAIALTSGPGPLRVRWPRASRSP
ncbi:MAG: DUF1850 domain-containing protein [bacterium]